MVANSGARSRWLPRDALQWENDARCCTRIYGEDAKIIGIKTRAMCLVPAKTEAGR
jgi:hypothetical protein